MAITSLQTGAATCWIVTEGHAGSENQCIGLAEAIGLSYRLKRVHPRAPWTWLPVTAWPMPLAALDRASDPIVEPWPDLLIAAGRRSIPYALFVRERSGGRTFTVYIQNPRTSLNRFDAIIAPEHDGLAGPNVIATKGSVHRVTPRRIADEAEKLRERVAYLPRPLVAVLIGGSNRIYRIDEATIRALAERLRALAEREGAGLLVTPSRRTGVANVRALHDGLRGVPAEIWDFAGDNPYFAYLGLADHIVVTGDSVSMVSEACSTGKPVYVAALEGRSTRFDRFHASLREGGYTRLFEGRLTPGPVKVLAETERAAGEIARRLRAHAPA